MILPNRCSRERYRRLQRGLRWEKPRLDWLKYNRQVGTAEFQQLKGPEAAALLEAMQFVRATGHHNVIFESDAQVIVDAISSNNADPAAATQVIEGSRKAMTVANDKVTAVKEGDDTEFLI
ncbi:hypothetical protein L195_g031232, partial [Trifolium pratense]